MICASHSSGPNPNPQRWAHQHPRFAAAPLQPPSVPTTTLTTRTRTRTRTQNHLQFQADHPYQVILKSLFPITLTFTTSPISALPPITSSSSNSPPPPHPPPGVACSTRNPPSSPNASSAAPSPPPTSAAADLRRKLSLLSKSHHANLIKLHGAAVSGNYIYMVYEHIIGASLCDCLRNPRNPNFTVLSNWLTRIQIAAGIADGLDYMHNCVGGKLGFVHNHVKSSSIVVSEMPSLAAKICHFGTAQLCGEVPEPITMGEDEVTAEFEVLRRVGSGTGKFEGTRGYMSPEFQVSGVATLKSDVFAFGVVVLELLSGKEPMKVEVDKSSGAFRKVSLIEMGREAVDGGLGRLRQWVDRRLKDSYPVEVAEGLARVALECVQEDPVKRPDMGRVAGWISRLFLDSKTWAQSMRVPEDLTVSFAPR